MDQELVDLVRPFSTFMYRTYWRATTSGLEQVPSEGPALLLANHGGVLPWDSMMIATAVLEEHANPRVVRSLYAAAFRALPGITRSLAVFGQVADTPENALRLLADGQLVCVFPEGVNALGKLFKNRYKLQRFRRSGSVGLAIKTSAPIIPVAVVGAEETYPMLANAHPLAQMLRLPFFPLTPLFPWLGPVGLLPLPSKWSISFGEPIASSDYRPDAAEDPQALNQLANQVRDRLQAMLDERLANRKSVFS
jgi:1-acyl-sn-glycerol-3-phosphate acyltransferase